MSGTSSRMSSSTSALGIRSYTYPERGSSSSESPARSVSCSSGSGGPAPRPPAGLLVALGDDHVERLVQDHFLAGAQLGQFDVRGHVDPHLAPAGEYVGRVVLARAQEDAEPGRRLGQPVHFLPQRGELVARLAQRCGQPLVLGRDAGETSFRLPQPLFHEPDLARGIRQPAPKHGDLLVEEGDLSGKALHLILMPRSASALFPVGHGPHLLLSLLPTTLPTTSIPQSGDVLSALDRRCQIAAPLTINPLHFLC